MPRNQSRTGQRARAAQKATDTQTKYTELLRAKHGPRGTRREPGHAEPTRRLASLLRAHGGADGEKAARLVDEALAWALKDHGLKQALLRTPAADSTAARTRFRAVLDDHAAGEVTVHDAPLLQVVHMVLEAAAEEEENAELLRAAADVLDRLVGASHICNAAIYGVRAGGWLAEPRMVERVYTTTDPVAVVAAAALRTMREAARIPDEDELTDADCMFTLHEVVRFARTAADLAARSAA